MNTVTSTERPRIVTDHTTAEIYTSILFPWFPFRSEEAMEFNLGGGSWRLRNGRRRVVNGEVFYFSRRARTEHVANCIIAETHRRSKYRPLLREPQTKGRGEPLGARSQTWSGFDSTRLGSAGGFVRLSPPQGAARLHRSAGDHFRVASSRIAELR